MLKSKKIILSLLLLASVAHADFFTDFKTWALEAVPEKGSSSAHPPEVEATHTPPQSTNPTTITQKFDAEPHELKSHAVIADATQNKEPYSSTHKPINSSSGQIINASTHKKKPPKKHHPESSVIQIDVSDKLPIEFVNTYGHKVATAHPDKFIINEDSQITFNPVLNDIFYKADDYRIISIGHVKNADIKLKGNEITVFPNIDFHGNIDFDYVIASKDNKTLTSDISIRIMPINDRPIAKDDLILTQEDIQMVLPSLTNNDTDKDGDNLEVIKVSQPNHGEITEDSGVWVYTPNKDFYGIEKLSYTIRDEKGAIDKAVITIIVKGVNDDPMAIDDEYKTNEDTNLKISDFMANDMDVDKDLFHLTGHTKPSYGSIAYNGKSLVYTPEKDFNGKDYFYYTISDTKRNTSKARITVIVTAQNDEPITKSDGPFKTEVSKPIYITSAMDNDSDVDGDELSISTYTRPINGEVSFDENQTFIYIPNPGFVGIDRFTYTVTDGENTSDVSTIEIHVEEKKLQTDSETKTADVSEDEDEDEDEIPSGASEANDVLNAIKHF